MTNFLSDFISAYRKGDSANHALLRLIENWKAALDSNLFTGAVLMDLSEAFDYIPHDPLIAKLHAYGFNFGTLTFLNSYLRNRKQCVKINNICSDFLKILSGVPQGSILGPILFNIFLNDLFLCLKKTSLHNFAEDNTITTVCDLLADLIKILETEGELSVGWLREYEMVVNSDKFQVIILNKKEAQAAHKLIIDNKEIKTTNSIKLLGINIDDQLRFNEPNSILCSKATMQLNALSRLQKYMGKSEKEAIINSFILSNFNYCVTFQFLRVNQKNKKDSKTLP